MIPRYTRKEMAMIWEAENRFNKWLKIEMLVCEALAELGEIPPDALKNIKENARFDIKRIEEIEKVTKHDVIAFLTCVGEYVGENSRYIHMGLTSSDILDTSMAVILREAADIIIADLERMLSVLKKKAYQYKDTVMVGRTHGIHAEPITFGMKIAVWYDETKRNLDRMRKAKDTIGYGKISGAVGTFAFIPPFVEGYVCQRSDLKPAPISTQIIQRDRYAEYLTTLAIIASSVDKFATEIRHLQRTEVLEAEEFFSGGQKGSSAMPHKRNPILSENLSGLARVVRSNSLAALENIALWHERDISHSSVERIILPDSTMLVDFMLNRITGLIDGLQIYPENMLNNLYRTHGLIFSQGLLLALTRKGVNREDAYEMVQRNAMRVWKEGTYFRELILQDKAIMKHLTENEVEECFDINWHLRHIDEIFQRVFG
ncbi:MAG: adenylosuccinate lyase [Desulfobacterales bacterium]|nr:adenylosuccinate lyase [Desulfobacterales bacterium]